MKMVQVNEDLMSVCSDRREAEPVLLITTGDTVLYLTPSSIPKLDKCFSYKFITMWPLGSNHKDP